MHYAYCVKNITRCAFCRTVLDAKELEKHIADAKGSVADMVQCVRDGDVPRLKAMSEHGQSLECANELDSCNTLVHYAVRF